MDFADVRVRLAVTLAVILGCVYLIYPMERTINLGLDLKGGVHMVMRVRTDDAVKAEVDLARERIRSVLSEKGIAALPSPDEEKGAFTITGIDGARVDEARTLIRDQYPQYSIDAPAAGALRMSLRTTDEGGIRDSAVRQALETIRTRIDKFGVAEPVIQRKGVGPQADQIVVQLPGVEDPERVKGLIGEAAFLEWKMVKVPPGVTAEMFRPADSEATLRSSFGGTLPPDVVAMPQDVVGSDGRHQTFWWPVTRSSPITGNDLKNARRDADRFGGPAVNFLLSAEAGQRFQELTRANQGQMLAIVLDQKIISAPRINAVIAERGIIEGGNFTVESAEDLALKLRSGALPAGLDILEERTVGASLGADSIRHGVIATIVGAIVIILFMLVYYHLAGVNANVALVANILIVLAAMAIFRSTLTLPGIAGMALTVGMAVDANVLVFERIREELRHGRTVRGAINLGFERAFATIIDSHCTTLIAGFALLSFGTGPVKGFAVTLSVGIVANLFTSLYMSRALFDTLLWLNPRAERLSI
ncbi:MAG TPA: protein translocase subunit SecD [Candidatus Polarisedimenticolia bacterium]|nr:protein translocase subunit SecD [Candidatus Polarisedimenticolia bacterium]